MVLFVVGEILMWKPAIDSLSRAYVEEAERAERNEWNYGDSWNDTFGLPRELWLARLEAEASGMSHKKWVAKLKKLRTKQMVN